MSENLRLLGRYSDAMAGGSDAAVYEFFSPDFTSHVTERINPEMVGTDIRGSEQKWWREAKAAFPDMTFTVNLLVEQDDIIVSNWSVQGTHTGAAFNGIEPRLETCLHCIKAREYALLKRPAVGKILRAFFAHDVPHYEPSC